MTAGGNKSRYIEGEVDRQLEEDLNELSAYSLGGNPRSNESKLINPQQNTSKSFQVPGSSIPEHLRRDPIAFWAWHLERDINTYNQDSVFSSAKKVLVIPEKIAVDLSNLFLQTRLMDIQNVDELSAKIERMLMTFKKNLEKPIKSNKTSGREMQGHLEQLINSINLRVEIIKARREELEEVKERCRLMSINPLANLLLGNVLDTGDVILGHLAEQSDYLSKEEKVKIHKLIKEVMIKARNVLDESFSGADAMREIKMLDEHLKEDAQKSGKLGLDDLYHKTRKNVVSRLRKALNYSYLEKHDKELDRCIEDCLKTTAAEFAVMNNKFYDRKDNLISNLSANEFIGFCKDFNREWGLWAKNYKKAAAEDQLPRRRMALTAQSSLHIRQTVSNKNRTVLPMAPEPHLPRAMAGGWVGSKNKKR